MDDIFVAESLVKRYKDVTAVVGFVVKGLPTMNLFNSLVILPMIFLCGTLFSVSAYPQLVQDIINFLPLTHTTNCVTSAALGWDFPYDPLLILIIFGCMFFVLSYRLSVKNRV